MSPTSIIRTFDKIALRLFHTLVIVGLGAAALGAVVQSIQA
jgi:hypothetical protein